MRLYKAELYKLCHRKIFVIGSACVIGIMLFFFTVWVSEEWAYVDGITYQGYEGIKVNRRITEEFEGVLTDDKVNDIIEKYGFPQKVIQDYGGFRDANFLNAWVVEYLSDGYFRNFDDIKVASRTYPIGETLLGEASQKSGREIILEYSNGWNVFLQFIQVGMILGGILIVFSLAGIFAGEGQTKMLSVIFTTKEGRSKDIMAKYAAAFTVAAGVWCMIVIMGLVLCGLVYGFGGLDCMIGTTKIVFLNTNRTVTMQRVGSFVITVLLFSLLGILLLCAVTLCISARFRSVFHAVVSAALYFAAPILIWLLIFSRGFGGIVRIITSLLWYLLYATPFYLIQYGTFIDIYQIRYVIGGIALSAFTYCAVSAYRSYQKQAG